MATVTTRKKGDLKTGDNKTGDSKSVSQNSSNNGDKRTSGNTHG
jgi:hypothetical protein